MSLLNQFSFLVFSATSPESSDLLGLNDGGVFSPTAASVIMAPGETYTVYIPFTDAITFTNNSVDLVSDKDKALKLVGIGTTTQINLFQVQNHYSLSFGVRADVSLLNGYYRLRLNTSNGPIYSNRLWLNKDGYQLVSLLYSFRNTRPIGPIAYDLASMTLYRNVLRLKSYIDLPKTETSIEEYEEQTTGVKRAVEIKAHEYVPIITPNTDAIGRHGWKTLLLHKDLLISGNAYSLKTGYTEGEGNNRLCDARFEVWNSAYSVINRC